MVLTSILLPSDTKVEMPTPLRSADQESLPRRLRIERRLPDDPGAGRSVERRVEADEWISVDQSNAVGPTSRTSCLRAEARTCDCVAAPDGPVSANPELSTTAAPT